MNSRSVISVYLVLASASLVFVPMGCKKAPPVTLTAAAAPPAVYPGEPVTVTATPGDLSTKKHVSVLYSWSGDAVTGNGTTATVATSTLAPGTYTVKATVKEGKPGKEGLKPGQSAEAAASYTVKPFEPPTISIAANPSTIKPGEESAITATGQSPQNRPLTYAYSATAGTVNGTGASATFNSTGAPTGTVTVTGTVTDDKGQTASATTSVTVLAPYVPPVPHVQALATINFGKDKKRPVRVDNEDKANLDSVALALQKDPDAKLVLVGESTTAEKTPKKGHKHAKVADLAAERAVNVKDYLVTEKGIDASRISVATGTADAQAVEPYLVPSGATFAADVQGTTPVDESLVKAQPRKPLGAKKHHHAKAAE
jgi:outer membrane protein OmpA-like peptidoglycan-associated protein